MFFKKGGVNFVCFVCSNPIYFGIVSITRLLTLDICPQRFCYPIKTMHMGKIVVELFLICFGYVISVEDDPIKTLAVA